MISNFLRKQFTISQLMTIGRITDRAVVRYGAKQPSIEVEPEISVGDLTVISAVPAAFSTISLCYRQ